MNQSWKQNQILTTTAEKDYELIDSGEGEKLERFGKFVLSRPDPQALWVKKLGKAEWAKADGIFSRGDDKGQTGSKGRWQLKAGMPEKWRIDFAGLKFWIEPTPFKHVGLFPEQKNNWEWMKRIVESRSAVRQLAERTIKPNVGDMGQSLQSKQAGTSSGNTAHFTQVKRSEKEGKQEAGKDKNGSAVEILNLFGYTGGATLACAAAGASVVHVDGSKVAVTRAKENAELSGLGDKPVRWLVDDARDFVKRELRRGRHYDGIIMDPPAFGRGDKGQVWKIEDDFVPFFNDCLRLLSDKSLFFIINGYAAGYSPIAYANNLEALQKKFGGTIEAGELAIEEKEKGKKEEKAAKPRLLPCGIFARWSAK